MNTSDEPKRRESTGGPEEPPPLPPRRLAQTSSPPPLPPRPRPTGARPRGRLRPWWMLAGLLLAVALLAILWRSPRPDGTPSLPLAENGLVLIDAQPWGEVVRVVDSEGGEAELPEDPYTPLALQLPPGEYEVSVAHPSVPTTATCRVEAAVGVTRSCQVELLGMAARSYFKDAGWWP